MSSSSLGSRIRLVIAACLLVLLAGIVALGSNPAMAGMPSGLPASKSAAPAASKITPQLLEKFNQAGQNGKVHYWVIMADQADTSNNITNSRWAEKGWYVYNMLVAKANATQKPLLARLDSLKQTGQVSSVEGFWIINSIMVTGDLSSAQAMAADAAVAEVRVPLYGQIYDEYSSAADGLSPAAQAVVDSALKEAGQTSARPLLSQAFSPFVIQHNLNEVHAPQAWALGYDGTGVVVSSMDTGVRWTHEALTASYRGNVAPPDPAHIHDYNWFDGYLVSATPIDQGDHGSHTMGTVLGVSPNATYGNIGVAKGATWTTVRICDLNGVNGCDSDAIMRGFQWTLAPTRVGGIQDPRPDLRPRVSNNSWGGGPGSCDLAEAQAVTNWVNAGIFPAFSNGNDGPGAGTVGSPASSPDAWGTGALGTNTANWVIASFSSRGPSGCDATIRPHAVAPGVNICSSIASGGDTGYSCGYSGTSMAAPHVTGSVAVLLQKNPDLSKSQLMYALTSTAFFSPTWGSAPNNNYGWGLIQLDSALNSVSVGPTATPTVTGTPPTATSTPSPTPTECVVSYNITTATATVVPGTQDIGNHCDDCTTVITFPFTIHFYGHEYTTGVASSNGNLQFVGNSGGNGTLCMPKAAFETAAFVYHNDLRTDQSTCPGGCGIYSATLGTAPNRTYILEWRVTYFGTSGSGDSEIIFYENNPNMLSMVYGTTADNGLHEVTGVQYGPWGPADQFSCTTATLTSGLKVDYTVVGSCPQVTPTVPVPTETITPVVTNTAVITNTPGPSATPCTLSFSDVHSTDYFYEAVTYLACHGAISGYSDGTFRPYNNTTRGQLSKIVVLAVGWTIDTTGGPHFSDVPTTNPFYDYIETAYNHQVISGYSDGTFRWGNNVTRGQLSKIVVEAMQWDIDTTGGPHFSDVPTTETFYNWIETAYNRGIISGYADGTFRPGNNATRGQIAKIVYGAVTAP